MKRGHRHLSESFRILYGSRNRFHQRRSLPIDQIVAQVGAWLSLPRVSTTPMLWRWALHSERRVVKLILFRTIQTQESCLRDIIYFICCVGTRCRGEASPTSRISVLVSEGYCTRIIVALMNKGAIDRNL